MAPPTATVTETCSIDAIELHPVSALPQSRISNSSKLSIPNVPLPRTKDAGYTLSSLRKSSEIGPNDEEVTNQGGGNTAASVENLPAGVVGVPARQTWNSPPINKWRILAAFYSFIVFGG